MTKTPVQAAALVLSALVTAGVVTAANAAATHEYVTASAAVAQQMPHLALQTVVVVGHRTAKA